MLYSMLKTDISGRLIYRGERNDSLLYYIRAREKDYEKKSVRNKKNGSAAEHDNQPSDTPVL